MSPSLLNIQQLFVQHGGHVVLAPFDWTVQHGERWAILGANGTGKTSVLHALLGVNTAAATCIEFDGQPLSKIRAQAQAELRVWVPQRYDEPFTLTTFQALRSVVHDINDEKIHQVLELYGLASLAQHWVHTLSGGERQRLTWAMSTARTTTKTKLWLLDEPLAAQDLAWQSRLLRQLNDTNCTVVAAVHDLNQVVQFATHVLLIQKNSITPAQVIAAGRRDDVMQKDLLSAVYGVSLRHIEDTGVGWWQVVK